MRGYKLFSLRKDGSLGPLFINRRQRVVVGEWMSAEDHPTKGYAHRPGWHLAAKPVAPHLSNRGRVWALVEAKGTKEIKRPASQGSRWFIAEKLRVIKVLDKMKGSG